MSYSTWVELERRTIRQSERPAPTRTGDTTIDRILDRVRDYGRAVLRCGGMDGENVEQQAGIVARWLTDELRVPVSVSRVGDALVFTRERFSDK